VLCYVLCECVFFVVIVCGVKNKFEEGGWAVVVVCAQYPGLTLHCTSELLPQIFSCLELLCFPHCLATSTFLLLLLLSDNRTITTQVCVLHTRIVLLLLSCLVNYILCWF
jgi:hypothetical protein